MGICEYVWEFINVYGILCMRMGIYERVWEFMNCVGIYMIFQWPLGLKRPNLEPDYSTFSDV
jgi:hypothetical protein